MVSTKVELVRAVYDGIAKGDPMPFMDLLHPDVCWHFPGTSWMAGDFSGQSSVLELFANIARLTDNTFLPVPSHIVGGDEVVVSVVDASATRAGRSLSTKVCVVWTFEGNRVIDGREHIFDVQSVDALWDHTTP